MYSVGRSKPGICPASDATVSSVAWRSGHRRDEPVA